MSNERLPVDTKDNLSLIKKIGAGVALSIALIAPAACSPGGSESTPHSQSDSQPEAEPTKEAPLPVEVIDFDFSAEKYTNNPEQIVYDYAKAETDWNNSGYFDGAADHDKRFSMDDPEYIELLNKPSDEKVANDFLMPNWENNSELRDMFNQGKAFHYAATKFKLISADKEDTRNKELYEIETIINEVRVVKADDSTIIANYSVDVVDNSDKNAVGEYHQYTPRTGQESYRNITFIKDENGKMRLAGFKQIPSL